jgi:malate dehydrogenase
MSKVTIVGAGGNVGASAVLQIALKEVASELVMIDKNVKKAEGISYDLGQVMPLTNTQSTIIAGTEDYAATAGSDVVVITAGVPRKEGMTREELLGINAGIMTDILDNVTKHSPNAMILIVANPLDNMVYLGVKKSGLPSERVFGMAGALDTARWRYYIAQELNVSTKDVQGMVIGGHGDTTMVPLPRYTSVFGIPLPELMDEARIEKVVQATMVGGKTITNTMGMSAWEAPGAGAALMVEAILRDQKRVLPACTYLTGQYGLEDICIGAPVVLGKGGVEKVLELKLNDDELAKMHASADAVRKNNAALPL